MLIGPGLPQYKDQMAGLVENYGISNANALEISEFTTKPVKSTCDYIPHF